MKRGRNQRRRQGVNPNRALDSNGPEVRIRGTANQIYDKYIALARDASSSGDRVKSENYLQHAEHYFRMIRSMQQAQQPQPSQHDGEGDQPTVDDGGEDTGRERRSGNGRDRRNGEASADSSDNGTVGAEASANDENGGDDDNDEGEKRPRRRRSRRPAKQADASADGGEEETAAAAE